MLKELTLLSIIIPEQSDMKGYALKLNLIFPIE